MSGRSIRNTHRFLCVHHFLAFTTLAFLSGFWHEMSYGITFIGKRKASFRILLATMAIEIIFFAYHGLKLRLEQMDVYEKRSVDTVHNRLRVIMVHIVMAIITLVVDVTNGDSDILLAVLATAVWMWRSDTYYKCENEYSDSYQGSVDDGPEPRGAGIVVLFIVTTPVALSVPVSLFFGSIGDVSVHRVMAFVILVSYVFVDLIVRLVAWKGRRNVEPLTFFIDVVTSIAFMANSIAFVHSDPD